MDKTKVKLSVIIPAYNESVNLKKGVLAEVADYLKKQDYSYEVIIVDDASKDETAHLVKNFIKGKSAFRLIENKHGGKAITVMAGLLQAQGEIVLFTDMDQATPLNQIEKFLPKFEEGFDVVIGRRKGRKGAPPIRKLYSWGFSVLRNILLGISFPDTQCGFKAFTGQSVEKIFPDLLEEWEKKNIAEAAVNAGFDIEALYIAKKKGLKITDVEVEWHYIGSERVGISAAIEALKDMLRIRLNS